MPPLEIKEELLVSKKKIQNSICLSLVLWKILFHRRKRTSMFQNLEKIKNKKLRFIS